MKFEILNVRNLVQPAPLEALPELQIQNQTRGNIYVQKIVNDRKFWHFNAGGKVGFMVCLGQNM